MSENPTVRYWTSFGKLIAKVDDEIVIDIPHLGNQFMALADLLKAEARELLADDPYDSALACGADIEVCESIDDSGRLTYCQASTLLAELDRDELFQQLPIPPIRQYMFEVLTLATS